VFSLLQEKLGPEGPIPSQGALLTADLTYHQAHCCLQEKRLEKRVLLRLCILMCGGPHMATNLSIDPDLIERALEVSGERTKKAAVTKALQEFIARRKQKRLLELMGKLEWEQSYDYKSERSRS
jgi:Arc/MetJ family transcription regulator